MASTLRILVLSAALAAGTPMTAGAVVVVGEFPVHMVDTNNQDAAPLHVSAPGGGSNLFRFTYDTAAVASQTVNFTDAANPLTPGAGGNARYTFLDSASLSLAGYTTTARPDNPLIVSISQDRIARDDFVIAPPGYPLFGPVPAASDPSNPVPAFPYLSFHFGFAPLSVALPTSTAAFGGLFMDQYAYLVSADHGIRPPDGYLIRFVADGPVSITTVPEPRGIAVLGLSLAALFGVLRHRRCVF
jgi:hypothetical protein